MPNDPTPLPPVAGAEQHTPTGIKIIEDWILIDRRRSGWNPKDYTDLAERFEATIAALRAENAGLRLDAGSVASLRNFVREYKAVPEADPIKLPVGRAVGIIKDLTAELAALRTRCEEAEKAEAALFKRARNAETELDDLKNHYTENSLCGKLAAAEERAKRARTEVGLAIMAGGLNADAVLTHARRALAALTPPPGATT